MNEQLMPPLSPTFEAGEGAPDAIVHDLEGTEVQLSSCWKKQPTIFVFIRHFGCPHCRKQLNLLNRWHSTIVEAGGQIIAICMGDLERSKQFQQIMRLKYPLFSDVQEIAYNHYGLLLGEPTLKWKLEALSMDAPAAASMIVKKEYGQFLLGGNKYRMGGTFIVDTHGLIHYAHRDSDSTDGAPVEEVVSTFKTMVGR